MLAEKFSDLNSVSILPNEAIQDVGVRMNGHIRSDRLRQNIYLIRHHSVEGEKKVWECTFVASTQLWDMASKEREANYISNLDFIEEKLS